MDSLIFLLLSVGPLSGAYFALKGSSLLKHKLDLFLAFAGAYLLSITLLNLVPEVFETIEYSKGLLVLAGFFFQLFLEKYSQGIEHGHMHMHHHLKRKVIPLGIVLSLSFHSFTEGFPLGTLYKHNEGAFYGMLIGITLHEFPAAFALATILNSLKIGSNRIKTILLVYAFMAALGATLGYILHTELNKNIFNYFLAFIIGNFLHISTTILFEHSEHHRFSLFKIIAVILGFGVAFVISLH